MALQDLLASRWLIQEDPTQMAQWDTGWVTLSQHLVEMKPMFDQATPEEKLWFIAWLMTASLPAPMEQLPPELAGQLPPM
jgi:hypothetical protein